MNDFPVHSDSPDDVSAINGAREEPASAHKRPYQPPRITRQGSVARIALGGTPGAGDSGATLTERPPG